jgi:hypothetical protein
MRDPLPRPSGLDVAAYPDRRGFMLDRWRGCYRPPRRCTSSAVGEPRKLRSTGASSCSGTSALLRRVDLGRVDLGLSSPS